MAEGPLVTFVLHKFSRGGSDRVAAHLARGFATSGFRVELVVFAKGGEVEQHLLDLVGTVRVRFIGRASRWRALDLATGLPAFVRHLREARPDVILSTANNVALVSALGRSLARLRDTRLALKTTNPIASSRHRGIAKWLRRCSYRWIFRSARAVWTLSEEETAEMRAAFPRSATLFRAVFQPYVTPAMTGPSLVPTSAADPIVLCIARLTAQKRLDRLIRAFAHVRFPGARLMILGEGEDRERLTGLVTGLGLEGRIEMPGYAPDVALMLRQANLFVLTSDYEGLPAAVLEAMAANCPVLSTDCFPSARSLVGSAPGGGIIEDCSPHALGAQIDRTLEAPRSDHLSVIAARYSVENGVADHVSALRELLGENEQRAVPGERSKASR